MKKYSLPRAIKINDSLFDSIIDKVNTYELTVNNYGQLEGGLVITLKDGQILKFSGIHNYYDYLNGFGFILQIKNTDFIEL